jgi:hypothetical protein
MSRWIDCDSSQFREQEVTAVGFNYENTSELSTGNILLGTSRGLIFEADIGSDGDKLINNNWKQVRRLNQLDLVVFQANFNYASFQVIFRCTDIRKLMVWYLPESTCSCSSVE